jgi:predicted Holliday junction resolvase-like endonuclease
MVGELIMELESAASLAPAISTYGVWAIISILIYCVVHLYKRTNDLEKELRSTILEFQERWTQRENEVRTSLTQALDKNTAVLDRNTEVMKDIRALFREQAIQQRVQSTIPPQ